MEGKNLGGLIPKKERGERFGERGSYGQLL